MHSLETALDYLANNWFDIVVIIGIAWAARHFGGAVITRIIRRLIRKNNDMSADDVSKRQNTLIGLLVVIWKIVVVAIAGTLIFRQLFPGIDLSPVFASAGIVGIALGFGAQSIIKDFLSGVFIITENQYRVGDVVDLEGAAGTVERVGVRTTMLRDADGNVHYMPNGNVMHVINKTMGFSKVNFTLSVNPETDIDLLADVINEVGQKMQNDETWKEKLLEAPHFLNIGNFSQASMDVTVVGKTQPSAQWSVTGELRRRLLRAFQKHAIELAQVPISGWSQPHSKKK
ncbi:MAG: mechanosensitive ion channel family protein [Candidatus Saccharimonadales bacterium]